MALSAKLQLKQSQSVVMTPQLMQSIKLLQLSNIELQQFIAEELEKNPILEADTSDPSDAYRDNREPVEPVENNGDEHRRELGEVISPEAKVSSLDLDVFQSPAMENLYDSGGSDTNGTPNQKEGMGAGDFTTGNSSRSQAGSDSAYNLEAFVAERISIQQYLLDQANLNLKTPLQRAIAEEIIASMDDDGYMRRDLSEIAEARNCAIGDVETVLSLIQTLDPPGICARDLKECLTVQLKAKNHFDPIMQILIENLHLLAKRDFEKLMHICGVNSADMQDMVAEIRSLSPRPASQFDNDPVDMVIPDVFVRAKADGGWAIELNHEALPKILINRTYYAQITKNVSDPKDITFMVDCLQSANWLVKSLDQRAQTILKVTAEIVKQQDMFFAYGISHLKPLNLKTVADNIKMHESTVSRVTSNKYIMTDRGIFEMKYFFSNAISSTNGDVAHSAEAVRHRIKALIDQETLENVYSDDTLVDILKADGIDIARRTIAKYRESLNIPSSIQRKREKKNINAAA